MSASHDERPLCRGVDVSIPSVARVYDYLLGGKDNFASDRAMAEEILRRTPDARRVLRANRIFLRRAVRYLAEAGIRQFLDIGAGLPTGQNVHQVAQLVAPDSRVVYVDNDPIVLSHGKALLAQTGTTDIVLADLRDPDAILTHPGTRALLDFDRPIALMLVAILHFIADADDPHEIICTLMRALPAGSFLVISHALACPDVQRAADLYDEATASAHLRTAEQTARFFDGLRLVEPGLVPVNRWRPDIEPYIDEWPEAWFWAVSPR